MGLDISASAKSLRLFVATFLSLEQQQALGLLQEEHSRLRDLWQCKLRWVKPIKMHLTWLFLGTVDTRQVPEITGHLKGLAATYGLIELQYDHCEFWPSPRKPRQLVLTPQIVPPQAQKLGQDIKGRLAHLAAKEDKHSFAPHITLLRLEQADNRGGFRGFPVPLEIPGWFHLDQTLPVTQTISAICLVESHVGQLADQYTIMETFPLGQDCVS